MRHNGLFSDKIVQNFKRICYCIPETKAEEKKNLVLRCIPENCAQIVYVHKPAKCSPVFHQRFATPFDKPLTVDTPRTQRNIIDNTN